MKKKNRKKQYSTSKTPETIPKISHWKRFREWFSQYLYNILYVAMLIAVWTYVIYNWEKCVSMQFFSQFDGNNILFLAGMIFTVLPLYEVEGKGVKIRRKGMKALERDLNKQESEYQRYMMQNIVAMMQSQNLQCQTGVTENDELSNSKQTDGC